MISVYFPEPDAILTSDGVVLDVFFPQAYCRRVHVHHVTSIKSKSAGKGNVYWRSRRP